MGSTLKGGVGQLRYLILSRQPQATCDTLPRPSLRKRHENTGNAYIESPTELISARFPQTVCQKIKQERCLNALGSFSLRITEKDSAQGMYQVKLETRLRGAGCGNWSVWGKRSFLHFKGATCSSLGSHHSNGV